MQWYITSEDKAILSYILNNQEYSKVTENGRGAGGKRSKLEHTSYLSHRSPIHRWRKNDHMEKFQISIHVEVFQIFHTTDVEKSEILPNLEEFQNSSNDQWEEI